MIPAHPSLVSVALIGCLSGVQRPNDFYEEFQQQCCDQATECGIDCDLDACWPWFEDTQDCEFDADAADQCLDAEDWGCTGEGVSVPSVCDMAYIDCLPPPSGTP